MPRCPLASPAFEWHLGRLHRHEQHVGVERQARHVNHRAADMVGVHARLDLFRQIGLQHAFACAMRSVSGVMALPISTWPQQMS